MVALFYFKEDGDEDEPLLLADRVIGGSNDKKEEINVKDIDKLIEKMNKLNDDFGKKSEQSS